MHKKRIGCFAKFFILLLLSLITFTVLGIIRFDTFSIRGKVLQTIEPNIYYVYTNLGTNEYGQIEENYEIINREYQTDGIHHMFTLGKYPTPEETINYARLKIFLKWPVYRILWLNFVY